jgi:DUF971 family protein
MLPIQIKLVKDEKTQAEQLSISWDDGHAEVVALKTLRDECPCAACKGETVLLRTYTPTPQVQLPGKYKLASAQQVGSYALGVRWGDGHSTGIYTWEHLRSLCECEICRSKKAIAGERSPDEAG